MSCPPEIARLLLEIVKAGILRARAASWAKDIKRVETETDHIHNLPALLLDFRPELLRYYLDTERECYCQARGGDVPGDILRLWAELDVASA